MAEILTLTDPEVKVDITTWRVVHVHLDTEAPAIKVELKSNTGEVYSFRYAANPSLGITITDVRNALSFINQGNFMVNQGKSLQRWLLEQINALGVKTGTISGSPD